jgi:serine O-acetyltransferase
MTDQAQTPDSRGTGGRPTPSCADRPLVATWWSTLRQDFECNEFIDARTTLAIWRAGQLLHRRPGVLPFLLRRVFRMADRLWTRGYIGAELPFQVTAGPGIRLPHAGRGVILHPTVRIGSDATVYHQVTVGVRDVPAGATAVGVPATVRQRQVG